MLMMMMISMQLTFAIIFTIVTNSPLAFRNAPCIRLKIIFRAIFRSPHAKLPTHSFISTLTVAATNAAPTAKRYTRVKSPNDEPCQLRARY